MTENQITFRRSAHDKKNPYVMISREMLQDKSISPKAKGILCYLLSLPDDWQIYHKQIQSALDIGEDYLNSAMDELLAAGYAQRTRERVKGLFQPYQYEISEFKIFQPNGENQAGSTGPVNPDIQKKYSLPSEERQKKQTTEQEGSVVCSFFQKEEIQEKLKQIDLPEESIKTILSLKPSLDAVNSALDCAKSFNPENPGGYIYEAIKGNWKPLNKSESYVQSNKDWVMEHKAKIIDKIPRNYVFDVLHSYFELGWTTGQQAPLCIPYNDKAFKEIVIKELEKIGVK